MKQSAATIIGLWSVSCITLLVLLSLDLSPAEPEAEEPTRLTPISYRVIPCNVAGHPGEYDYVIQLSTRDLEVLNNVCNILIGGQYHE